MEREGWEVYEIERLIGAKETRGKRYLYLGEVCRCSIEGFHDHMTLEDQLGRSGMYIHPSASEAREAFLPSPPGS